MSEVLSKDFTNKSGQLDAVVSYKVTVISALAGSCVYAWKLAYLALAEQINVRLEVRDAQEHNFWVVFANQRDCSKFENALERHTIDVNAFVEQISKGQTDASLELCT